MGTQILRVCIAGATGWSGRPLAEAILRSADLNLVGAVSRKHAGKQLASVFGVADLKGVMNKSVADALRTETDVMVDLTAPDVVKANVMTAINRGVHVVIGTSGLTDEDFAEIHEIALKKKVGVLAVGNFSITAILLEHFALQAAQYLSSWEILDYASARKVDSPSGVSRQLAFRLSKVRKPKIEHPIEKTVGPRESRGATFYGAQIHSIRLPGYTIALEIIFSEPDERLILRHEAGTGPEPYVEGALLAIRKVREHLGLIRGLDPVGQIGYHP